MEFATGRNQEPSVLAWFRRIASIPVPAATNLRRAESRGAAGGALLPAYLASQAPGRRDSPGGGSGGPWGMGIVRDSGLNHACSWARVHKWQELYLHRSHE